MKILTKLEEKLGMQPLDGLTGKKLQNARLKRLWIRIIIITFIVVALLLSFRGVVRMVRQYIDAAAKSEATFPVKVINASQRDMVRSIQQSGVVKAWQKAVILSEVAGKVKSISAKVGDSLEPGSPILKIDDEMLGYSVEQAKAHVLQLEANHETSVRELKRKKNLFKNKVISDFEFDIARAKEKADRAQLDSAKAQLKITQRDLRETAVSSPIKGILAERTVDIGTNIGLGTKVATVVDIEQVKIRVGVSEKAIADIKEGLPVTIETDACPGHTYNGSIYSVGTKADDLTLTFPLEVVIKNDKKPILKPGMVARLSIETGTYKNVVALPQEAVVTKGDRQFVWTIEENKARPLAVTIGQTIASQIIISEGLSVGQAVIVSGHEILKDGSAVAIVE